MGWLQDILDRFRSDEPREPYYIIRKKHLGLLVDTYFSQMIYFYEDAPGHKARKLKATFLESEMTIDYEQVSGFRGTWTAIQNDLKIVAVLGKRAGLSLDQTSDWFVVSDSNNASKKKAALCKKRDVKITEGELQNIDKLIMNEGWLRAKCKVRIEEIDSVLASSDNTENFRRKIKIERNFLNSYYEFLLSFKEEVTSLRKFSAAVHEDVKEARVELITPNPRIGKGKGGESLPDRW